LDALRPSLCRGGERYLLSTTPSLMKTTFISSASEDESPRLITQSSQIFTMVWPAPMVTVADLYDGLAGADGHRAHVLAVVQLHFVIDRVFVDEVRGHRRNGDQGRGGESQD
jgi:hypothetical protein